MNGTSYFQLILFIGTFLVLGHFETAYGSRFSNDPDEEEPDVECRRLPPNPERTSVAGETSLNIVDILNGGLSQIMTNYSTGGSTSPPRDVILILGNSGAGKTTITQILTSNLSRLHWVETDEEELVIVDDDDRIGVPTTVSRTLIPELVALIPPPSPVPSSEEDKDSPNLALPPSPIYFYDCPGFDDTRGPEFDLAANIFINQIIRNAHRVKLLFLVSKSALKAGNDRFSFDLLAKHATKFVRNLTRFENSIGLVVTKVQNFTPGKKNLNPDSRILKQIVTFLSGYNQTQSQMLNDLNAGTSSSFAEDEKDEISRKLQFLHILLHQDNNDKYDRIAFSREPVVCGPLVNSDSVIDSKKKMTELYQRLEYGVVGSPRNFGYTLKPLTIQKFQNFSRDINNAITRNVQTVMQNFTEWFDGAIFQETDLVRLSTTLQTYWADVGNVIQTLPVQWSPPEFGATLKSLLERMGYQDRDVLVEFQQFMQRQSDSLNFFEEIIGATGVDRSAKEWTAPILPFHKRLGEYRDWYSFCVQVRTRVVSYDFHKNKPTAPLPSQRGSTLEWANWIAGFGNVFVGDHIKHLASDLADKHGGALVDIVSWSMEPVYIACTGTSVTVKGNFVRFGQFLEGNGQLKGQCIEASTLQVYAADTAFIDANVDAVGKEMSMVVIAPRWEVEGSVLINLDGRNAPDNLHPRKALNGFVSGASGKDGVPGKPGGPGGAFLGMAGEIQRATGLTISVLGGNGGRGQDGGDGVVGAVGPVRKYEEITKNNVFRFYKKYGYNGAPGGAGGNGGMGGMGGSAGKAGYVKILSKDGGKINIVRRDGVRGGGGAGGLGGQGGQGSTSQHCYEKRSFFVPHDEPCTYEKKADGPNGAKGLDDRAAVGLQQPKLLASPNVKVATDFFRGMFIRTGNRETIAFINTFN